MYNDFETWVGATLIFWLVLLIGLIMVTKED